MAEEQASKGAAAAPGADWALSRAAQETAEAYLKEQTRLARLQADDIVREDRLRHWQLRFSHLSTILKLAFELALAFIFVVAAAIVVGAMWSAMRDRGLVVESFSVPPDLAARGLTGEVVATRLLDRLAVLQAQTGSSRASSSYANNWGSDIKVQIPDTGVSIGEFNRFLHGWLGHQTRISGDIYHTPVGIAVTARAGNDTSPTFTGPEADLDGLMQKAAEAVYKATQPYRYAVYLTNSGRAKEAEAVYGGLIANGSPEDRAWAVIGLGNLYSNNGDLEHASVMFRQALALRPDFSMAYSNILETEISLQHDEAMLATYRKLARLAEGQNDQGMSERAWSFGPFLSQAGLAAELGDIGAELKDNAQMEKLPELGGFVEGSRLNDLTAYAALHDGAGIRAAYANLPPSTDPRILLPREGIMLTSEVFLGNPAPLLRERAKFDMVLGKRGVPGMLILLRRAWPIEAWGMALLGEFADAHRLIDKTPVDCTICLRARGYIDARERKWSGAGFWFARAVRFAPSIPFAYTDWGWMLLEKGDYDGAIAKFRAANLKGPHFGDPLEMWGEALMQKNRSDLALAKFEEADKYAPNWGRLHLKWGEALLYAGKRDEAQRQFAVASHLDLSAQEENALHGWVKRHD
jgi:tetratricopeptide (TPR) repeat protein